VTSPFRIGLIGAGGISRVYMNALDQVPEGDAVAVWSRTEKSASEFAEHFGLATATTDLETLLGEVDVVCVNSPNACHAEHAFAAARAGVHVIVEKPFAVSLEQGRAIISACDEAGVGLAYAEELPFVPRFVEAKRRLDAGHVGQPLYVTQREAHGGPYSPWFFTRDEAGGGVLMDMACHSIECVRWLLGKPAVEAVTAQIDNTGGHPTILDDHAVLHLRFAGGVSALCEASWVLQGGMQSTLEVWGREGTLEVDLLQQTGIREFRRDRWTTPLSEVVRENGYPQELSHFLRCFAEGRTPLESGEDGMAVLEIMLAAYASARERREVRLPFQPEGIERAVDLWLRAPG
jgi:myo-inositol 2-dehydrogenase/D-chiro-inositol 1-dehydrogenase